MNVRAIWILGNWRNLTLAAFVLMVVGCGPSGPRIVPVSGQVLIDGEPLAAGVEGYVQVIPTNGRPASGAIDPATGRFSLTTWKEGDGCILGTHRVTVTVRQTVGVESISLIPEKYDDLSKTDLEVTIDGPIDSLVIELTGPLQKARTDAAPISDDPNIF